MQTESAVLSDHYEDEAIRYILEGTVAEVGEGFFGSLVENLSQVLQTAGAWITEYVEHERRLNSLAFYYNGQLLKNYSYSIAGTACEQVIVDKRMVYIPDRLLDLYKGNDDLAELKKLLKERAVVSYLGVPLLGRSNNILGHLSVIDSRTIPNTSKIVNIFRIFASRASAELLRLQAEQDIVHSEQRFRKLFDSTMDAIVEIDRQFAINRINLSGEQLLGARSTELRGKLLNTFFAPAEYSKIKALAKTLEKQPEENRSLWIPGGLTARTANGVSFPAEGTLSKYELDKESYFILILRNEEQRIRAEQVIRSMSVETEYLKEEIRKLGNFDTIIGSSRPLQTVLEQVRQVAGTEATILISGETGTGKEAIARAIHTTSGRSKKPLITVNCAAIPGTLIESEFFGHEKGSFTGATNKRQGRFQLADKGTIFLDEIGELPIDMQAKLLRVLQEGDFEPIGSSTTVHVDVRVIAATNRDLPKEIEKGNFRQDLYYRLNVFPLDLPPLKVRGDDVVELALHFNTTFSRRLGHMPKSLSPEDRQRLKSYHWPGNIRELRNVIERAVIVAQGNSLNLQAVLPLVERPASTSPTPRNNEPARQLLSVLDIARIEKENFLLALETTGWRVAGPKGAARLLGVHPSTFASRMKKLGIARPGLG